MQTLADMRGVGVKIGENMRTSFVDGPKVGLAVQKECSKAFFLAASCKKRHRKLCTWNFF